MSELLSMRAYAKRRGVSTEAVSKAVKKGRLAQAVVTMADGKRLIDPEIADREWSQNTRPEYPRPGPETPPPATVAPPAEDSPTGRGPSVVQSTAVLKAYQARLAKLEFDERSGKLIDAETVKKQAFKVARTVRDSILAIPAKLAPELASETDSFVIHRRLEEELRQALETISAEVEVEP